AHGGHRLAQALAELEPDRLPALRAELGVDALDDLPDLAHVVAIGGDVLSRRLEEGPELDPALQLRVMGEQFLVGEEAADDVLRWVRAVDAHDKVLGPPVTELALFDHHAMR